jgi:hypothetical protein
MIEFSTQSVSADSKETLLALFILLIFALVAAGYVLKVGMEKCLLNTLFLFLLY